jgi:ferredoxin-NADP reductase
VSQPGSEPRKAAYREVEADLAVRRREMVADGVVTLTLARPDGGDLPEWTPGAHIDLVLAESLARQYSLCGTTSDRTEWRVGILLDPKSRGGSQFVHEQVLEGSTIRVRGPRNHFPLVNSPRYQFVAGGIGVTPILTMIEAAEARGADWRLLYGGRERASMGFLDELERHGERVTVYPQDELGMLDLAGALGAPAPDTLVYCCGPEGLLAAVEEACRQWPEGSLHLERFSAKPASDKPSPDALETFEVVCQRSGVTLTVGPDQTIYDVIEAADIDVLASCMEGVCGTCEVEVLEGEVDHRDSVLSEAERAANDGMMICVSRSRSERLVLDI